MNNEVSGRVKQTEKLNPDKGATMEVKPEVKLKCPINKQECDDACYLVGRNGECLIKAGITKFMRLCNKIEDAFYSQAKKGRQEKESDFRERGRRK